jgi:hypothetical protein
VHGYFSQDFGTPKPSPQNAKKDSEIEIGSNMNSDESANTLIPKKEREFEQSLASIQHLPLTVELAEQLSTTLSVLVKSWFLNTSPRNTYFVLVSQVALHPDEATEACVRFAITNRKPFAVVPCCVFSRLFPYRRVWLPEPELPLSTSTFSALSLEANSETKCAETAAASAQVTNTIPGDALSCQPCTGAMAGPLSPPSSHTQRSVPKPVTSHDDFLEYLVQLHPSIKRATLPCGRKNTVLYVTDYE